MSDEEFSHHVNKSKNDFRNWIHHVIEDTDLSSKLSRLRSRTGILHILEKRINYYRFKLRKKQKPVKVGIKTTDTAYYKENTAEDSLQELQESKTHITPYLHEMTPAEIKAALTKEFIFGLILGIIIGFLIYIMLLY